MVDAGSSELDVPAGAVFDPLRQVIADYPFLRHEVHGLSRDLGPYEVPSVEDPSLGIETLHHSVSRSSYNLSGQRVGRDYRGFVIGTDNVIRIKTK